ncbi:Acyl-CoA N-acyltransferases superfamily protein [Prunus dulcis]|uniref:Protein FAR1-RELATED SEQUENCE n=1 Tax=Prunus dulcis TaxID=3755 RepID=A0A4Y1R6P6_PRUDU|nr:Acyl-CoA N-acyltransferases superfamily protein [Prunus dulcis]
MNKTTISIYTIKLPPFSKSVDLVSSPSHYMKIENFKVVCGYQTQRKNLSQSGWMWSTKNTFKMGASICGRYFFSRNMSSSQRVEGVHAFFKLYISKRNSLMDFILRFNRALAQQRHEEIIDDRVDINEQPMLKSPLIMEKQMVVIYTRKIFYKFQKELWKCLACVLQLAREDDNLCFYTVMERKKDGSFKLKVREVMVDKVADYAPCICKKFEFEGIHENETN